MQGMSNITYSESGPDQSCEQSGGGGATGACGGCQKALHHRQEGQYLQCFLIKHYLQILVLEVLSVQFELVRFQNVQLCKLVSLE